jgi:hypothetical protein
MNEHGVSLDRLQEPIYKLIRERPELLPYPRSRKHVANLINNLFRDTQLNCAELDKQQANAGRALTPSGALKEHHAVENSRIF